MALEFPVQVTWGGGELSWRDRRKLKGGATLTVYQAPGTALPFGRLTKHADVIRNLTIHWVDDVSWLADLPALETLAVGLSRRRAPVEFDGFQRLQSLGLTNADAGRALGWAISAPRLERLSVWSPKPELFRDHATSATWLRITLCARMSSLPELVDPTRLKELWIQEIPALDLQDLGRFTSLERLTLDHVKRGITGLAGLRAASSLRTLYLGDIGGVDDREAIFGLPLERFHEWGEPSKRIWRAPDFRRLAAEGVSIEESFLPTMDAYEARRR